MTTVDIGQKVLNIATLAIEKQQRQTLIPSPETPLMPGVECYPYDLHTFEYESCHNSSVTDPGNQISWRPWKIQLGWSRTLMTILQ